MKYFIYSMFSILLCLSFTAQAEEDLNLRKNVVVIFDDSGSMSCITWNCPIDQAKSATSKLIAGLPNDYNFGLIGLNSGYVVPLNGIDSKVKISNTSRYEINRSKALNAVSKISAGGGTQIGKALEQAQSYLKSQKQKQSGYGFYTVVIITDGAANEPDRMFRAVDRAIKTGINIKTIGFGISRHRLMEVTQFVDASSAEELTAALKEAVKAEVPANVSFVEQDF